LEFLRGETAWVSDCYICAYRRRLQNRTALFWVISWFTCTSRWKPEITQRLGSRGILCTTVAYCCTVTGDISRRVLTSPSSYQWCTCPDLTLNLPVVHLSWPHTQVISGTCVLTSHSGYQWYTCHDHILKLPVVHVSWPHTQVTNGTRVLTSHSGYQWYTCPDLILKLPVVHVSWPHTQVTSGTRVQEYHRSTRGVVRSVQIIKGKFYKWRGLIATAYRVLRFE